MVVEKMDCTNWDEDAYRESILIEREILTKTIFRTAFSPGPTSDYIVTASSDGSIASYSISTCLKFGCGNASAQKWLMPEPDFVTKGHDGPAYDVKFYGQGDDTLLLSCGDDGRIKGWKWKEIVEDGAVGEGSKLNPVLDLANPQHKGPWGALSPIPENNAIAVHNQSGSIYAATGDSRAYCWDMETSEVKMVFKGHSDYLHCIVACNLSNQIITGSEDGTARIWDCKSGKCVQVICPEKDKKMNAHVSCISLDSNESWLACGKGRSLSLWNLPARECVLRVPTRVSVQDVMFDDNQIISVGAEPLLTRLNINGEVLSEIQCAPQSIFSISKHPSGVTAVSGYGGLVDMISQFGSHSCTFRCRGL